MANDWIIDVLADLKTYARKNGLSELADQLDHATLIAATELASAHEKAPAAAGWDLGDTGRHHRAATMREHA